MQPDPLLKLRAPEIERTFNLVAIDLHRILIFDNVDMLENGFRIRSHDLYGPMPEIVIEETGDRNPVLDNIQRESAKLCAIVRARSKLVASFPGCKFLLPTRTNEGFVVGLHFDGRTVLAEDRSCWEAYHRLMEEAVKEIL